ncbi:Inner membrane protein YpjD [Burkholderiales bacterium]|nr:MAG: cytochrome C biogenesis protein [Burkholderiales bacterium]CAG1007800.1 Inner membrane protein YpjD [Burkholderiales bacterium]
MQTTIVPYLLIALAYAALAVIGWRRLWAVRVPGSPVWIYELERYLLPLVLLGHALLLHGQVWGDVGININFTVALATVAWLATALYWLNSLWQPQPGLSAMVLPVAAVGALLGAWPLAPRWLPYAGQPLATLHIVIALLAYGLFLVAAVQALLLMTVERRLHHGGSNLLTQAIPPLLTMEQALFRQIALAFLLLTVTVVSGMLFSDLLFQKPLRLTHHVLFSFLAWLVFAGLLFGRQRFGWRGRTALRWVLAGTVMLLLAYFGAKFVAEIVLGR